MLPGECQAKACGSAQPFGLQSAPSLSGFAAGFAGGLGIASFFGCANAVLSLTQDAVEFLNKGEEFLRILFRLDSSAKLANPLRWALIHVEQAVLQPRMCLVCSLENNPVSRRLWGSLIEMINRNRLKILRAMGAGERAGPAVCAK